MFEILGFQQTDCITQLIEHDKLYVSMYVNVVGTLTAALVL